MERRIDLHLHTFHSDGTFSPEEVVRRAKGLGLAAISVTDHDTVAGIPAALRAAEADSWEGSGQALEIIPGVEMTVVFRDRELHVLGYGVRIEDPEFSAFLGRMQEYRLDRIRKMIDRVRERGAQVTFEEVTAIAGPGSVGRPHLAEAMIRKGFVGSLKEAFDRYLGDDAPCFVRGATLTVPDAVRLIRDAGGVAVLAHPHRLVEDDWMPELVQAGIQGIEVYHSDHPPAVAEKYRRMAEAKGLLITGGSDCHGARKQKGPLIGSVSVPYERLDRLREAMRRPGA